MPSGFPNKTSGFFLILSNEKSTKAEGRLFSGKLCTCETEDDYGKAGSGGHDPQPEEDSPLEGAKLTDIAHHLNEIHAYISLSVTSLLSLISVRFCI